MIGVKLAIEGVVMIASHEVCEADKQLVVILNDQTQQPSNEGHHLMISNIIAIAAEQLQQLSQSQAVRTLFAKEVEV